MISLTNCIFSKNINSRGAALYIDGTNNFVNVQANLENITFYANSANFYGGAFYFGPTIWEIVGVFSHLNCSSNEAVKSLINKFDLTLKNFKVAGCGYIFFQRVSCSLAINNGFFDNNKAGNGGVFHLNHNLGSVSFSNNTFINNLANNLDITNSVGGVFSFKATSESKLSLKQNVFLNNHAPRGGVYFAISGSIIEIGSKYISIHHNKF